jgi:hypothetical protein
MDALEGWVLVACCAAIGCSTTPSSDGGSDGGGGVDSNGGGVALFCNGTPVQDCSTCSSAAGSQTQVCVYCTDAGVVGHCVADRPAVCVVATPLNATMCPCVGDASSSCPASYQVCTMSGSGSAVCDTCGDLPAYQGLACQNGRTCDYEAGCL